MKVNLAYGQGRLAVELPDDRTTVIQPSHTAGLPDERGAVRAALDRPIGARPLREWIRPGDRVCILFTDLTRATPNERLIPWLLDHLKDVPRENITLLNQLGTHPPEGQQAQQGDDRQGGDQRRNANAAQRRVVLRPGHEIGALLLIRVRRHDREK